jgi:hypothetical protein
MTLPLHQEDQNYGAADNPGQICHTTLVAAKLFRPYVIAIYAGLRQHCL